MTSFVKFLVDETGAVTVDWVVLTAATIGLGAAAAASIGPGMTTLATTTETALGDTTIASYLPAAPYVVALPRPDRTEVAESCPPRGKGLPAPTCTPAMVIIIAQLSMSDGTVWRKVSTTIDGRGTIIVYTDSNGNEVDAPEIQEGASDVTRGADP
jgi:hypothetical protein